MYFFALAHIPSNLMIHHLFMDTFGLFADCSIRLIAKIIQPCSMFSKTYFHRYNNERATAHAIIVKSQYCIKLPGKQINTSTYLYLQRCFIVDTINVCIRKISKNLV